MVIEKDHGRIETRRCYTFNQLDCLNAPERWPDLKSFTVIISERTIKNKTTTEQCCFISAYQQMLLGSMRQYVSICASKIACMVHGCDVHR